MCSSQDATLRGITESVPILHDRIHRYQLRISGQQKYRTRDKLTYIFGEIWGKDPTRDDVRAEVMRLLDTIHGPSRVAHLPD
jgi:hypothetical protein